MSGISIRQFLGVAPYLDKRDLSENYAAGARNITFKRSYCKSEFLKATALPYTGINEDVLYFGEITLATDPLANKVSNGKLISEFIYSTENYLLLIKKRNVEEAGTEMHLYQFDENGVQTFHKIMRPNPAFPITNTTNVVEDQGIVKIFLKNTETNEGYAYWLGKLSRYIGPYIEGDEKFVDDIYIAPLMESYEKDKLGLIEGKLYPGKRLGIGFVANVTSSNIATSKESVNYGAAAPRFIVIPDGKKLLYQTWSLFAEDGQKIKAFVEEPDFTEYTHWAILQFEDRMKVYFPESYFYSGIKQAHNEITYALVENPKVAVLNGVTLEYIRLSGKWWSVPITDPYNKQWILEGGYIGGTNGIGFENKYASAEFIATIILDRKDEYVSYRKKVATPQSSSKYAFHIYNVNIPFKQTTTLVNDVFIGDQTIRIQSSVNFPVGDSITIGSQNNNSVYQITEIIITFPLITYSFKLDRPLEENYEAGDKVFNQLSSINERITAWALYMRFSETEDFQQVKFVDLLSTDEEYDDFYVHSLSPNGIMLRQTIGTLYNYDNHRRLGYVDVYQRVIGVNYALANGKVYGPPTGNGQLLDIYYEDSVIPNVCNDEILHISDLNNTLAIHTKNYMKIIVAQDGGDGILLYFVKDGLQLGIKNKYDVVQLADGIFINSKDGLHFTNGETHVEIGTEIKNIIEEKFTYSKIFYNQVTKLFYLLTYTMLDLNGNNVLHSDNEIYIYSTIDKTWNPYLRNAIESGRVIQELFFDKEGNTYISIIRTDDAYQAKKLEFINTGEAVLKYSFDFKQLSGWKIITGFLIDYIGQINYLGVPYINSVRDTRLFYQTLDDRVPGRFVDLPILFIIDDTTIYNIDIQIDLVAEDDI